MRVRKDSVDKAIFSTIHIELNLIPRTLIKMEGKMALFDLHMRIMSYMTMQTHYEYTHSHIHAHTQTHTGMHALMH